MQKKAIPILITCMILALGGIIVIQYLWIRKSIAEKQELIDNKVLQAITNVDLKLSDYGTMAFFTGTDEFNLPTSDTLILLEELDTKIHPRSENQEKLPANLDVQIIRENQNSGDSLLISHTQIINHNQQADSIKIELSQIENELMQLEEVRTVFNHIRFETNPASGDFRLDSAQIDQLLKKELLSFNLDTLVDWGVYDTRENQYVIQPKNSTAFLYEIPLFKTDIISPGRYIFKLNLNNNQSLMWIDIRLMVFMSVLFILIILSAFLFAVRLIIKHKKISQIKSDFINNMTHEFKTPLASISLAADSIVHPNVIHDKKRIEEFVSIIQQEKSKLNQNVERILDVASLEKDSIIIPKETIDLTELIQDTVGNLQLLIQSKTGTISLNLADSIQIMGSPFHLSQAISNIVENGIKYSPEKPDLKIALQKKERHAELEITDQGIGMTNEQISKVFDSFYRAETGNIHNTKGFGLGLTYAKFVIEKMGGKIQVESDLKKGTRVIIQFPLI